MPAGAIKDERDMLIFSDRLCESIEESLHAHAVRVGQDQRERVIGAGFGCSVDVGVDIALIDKARWALAALPPDAAGAALLSDACFVLKEEAQALVFMR